MLIAECSLLIVSRVRAGACMVNRDAEGVNGEEKGVNRKW